VPRSIKDPITTHQSNVDGFLNLLVAARDAGVERMVYASSSSVYGDDPGLPKLESRTGHPLSPYALTKVIDEAWAAVFGRAYGFKPIGLRYFNVFGPRQDPDGPYAAVMPKWIAALLAGRPCLIHGDGETSRDFCFVANAVQANLLAGTAPASAMGEVFNVSFGGTTTLTQLYWMILDRLAAVRPGLARNEPQYTPAREGDIRHSQADLGKIRSVLGYQPTHSVAQGLDALVPWFASR
jgi:UDP-N-acetylglucosamine 4-epimerase